MGKNISYNLNKIYGEYIHVPLIPGGNNKSPLYAVRDTDEANSDIANLTRDEEWLKYSEHTYNSPTNARRLVITNSWVLLEFYRPFIENGAPAKQGRWRIKNIVNYDLKSAIQSICNRYSSNTKNINYGIEEDLYSLSSSAMYPIETPWVLSNLEEVIIDETSLFSGQLFDQLGAYKVIEVCKNKSIKPLKDSKALILTNIYRSDIREIHKKFPRLKVITMVPGISSILTPINIVKLNRRSTDTITGVLVNNKVINPDDCIIYKPRETNMRLDMGNLITRNYYRFDREVLSPYAKVFEEELARNREIARKAKEELNRKAEQAAKNSFELKLDEIAASDGDDVARLVYSICISTLSNEDRNSLAGTLTNSGKRYTKEG